MSKDEHGTGSATIVRSRQVFSDCGNPTISLGVRCPEHTRHVDLEDCLECQAFRGLRIDAAHRKLAVSCEGAGSSGSSVSASPVTESRSADQGTVESIMTTDVLCVARGLSIALLARLFLDRGISGAPVVDECGLPVGIVSKTDLVRHYSDERNAGNDTLVVADIMMDMAFCLPANESIAKAAALMAFEGMHRVPVVDPRGRVVGLVSSLDVLRWMARMHGYVVGDEARNRAR